MSCYIPELNVAAASKLGCLPPFQGCFHLLYRRARAQTTLGCSHMALKPNTQTHGKCTSFLSSSEYPSFADSVQYRSKQVQVQAVFQDHTTSLELEPADSSSEPSHTLSPKKNAMAITITKSRGALGVQVPARLEKSMDPRHREDATRAPRARRLGLARGDEVTCVARMSCSLWPRGGAKVPCGLCS